MRLTQNIFTAILLLIILSSCSEGSKNQNLLEGKVFRNISEIQELKNFRSLGGSILDANATETNKYRFAIGSYSDSNNFIICIFEELLKAEEEGKVNYKILDTINIGQLKETESLTYCHCRQDTVWDAEIIAVLVADNEKEFYDNIIRAWRANTTTGKIEIIKNLKGITCINTSFGAEGCGEDDTYDSDEQSNDITTDSLSQNIETDANHTHDTIADGE